MKQRLKPYCLHLILKVLKKKKGINIKQNTKNVKTITEN